MLDILGYSFFQNALLGVLIAGVAAAIVGTYIVTRRMVFIAGGVTHACFGGLGLGYFLGVSPTKPGYAEYEVRPVLGGLKRMQGSVPTPFGEVRVKMDATSVSVKSDGGKGVLVLGDRKYDIPVGKELRIDRF